MASVRLDPSPTQRRVLAVLKRSDEATADELAEALEITSSAVRQHLNALRAAGLVDSRKHRGQPGRPADRFFVTPDAEPLFSASDEDLSLELLEYVEAEDPEMVDRVFDRRRRKLVEEAGERLAGTESVDRIEALTSLLDEQGYLADAERLDDAHFRIKLHNCAMWSVANRFCQACSSELDFVREMLPGATVERVSHKTAGAHACAYDVHL